MRAGLTVAGSFEAGEPESSQSKTSSDYISDVVDLLASGFTRDQADTVISGYRSMIPPWDATVENSYLYAALADNPTTTIDADESARPYVLMLDGYGPLPNWITASWQCNVNSPDVLTLEYPADQEFATDLKRPNTISLFNGNGLLLQSFDIQNALPDVSRDGGTIRIKCKAESRLCRLRSAWIEYYVPGGGKLLADATETETDITLKSGAGAYYAAGDDILIDSERMTVAEVNSDVLTVSRGQKYTVAATHSASSYVVKARSIAQHVRALFTDYQPDGFPIVIDSLDPALENIVVAISLENTTLLDALDQLWTLSGMIGQYQITNAGRFAWVPTLGGIGSITLGVNLLTMERTVDDSNLCTRLYLYGAGASRESRVKLSNLSGTTVDYVESNTATYGVVPKAITLSPIKDAATLKTIADSYISIMSVPYLSYSATAADLAALNLGASPTIGSSVTIVDSELGIEAIEACLSIEYDLSDPTAIRYTFAKNTYDLADVIEKVTQQIAQQQTRDIAGELANELSGPYSSDSPFATGLAGAWAEDNPATQDNSLDDPRITGVTLSNPLHRPDRIGLPLILQYDKESDLPENEYSNIVVMAYCRDEDSFFLWANGRWRSIPLVQKDDDDVYRGYYKAENGAPIGFTHFDESTIT